MSISYEAILNLALPADGDTSWGSAMRQNIEVLAKLAVPTDCYFVSPQFTDANLHHAGASAPRFFSTLQAAHDAISTGAGYTQRPTIYVYPGAYAENLVVTKSCTIQGVSDIWARGLGGMLGASIVGTAASQSPLVTIAPTESNTLSVGFAKIYFTNAYSAAAGAIAKGYALAINPQTLYGSYNNYITFSGCDFRMQTQGVGNEWAAGFLMSGWNTVDFIDCTVQGMYYAGGGYLGGIHNLFYAIGNNTNSKTASFRVLNSRLRQEYTGTVYTAPNVFYLDNKATGQVSGTSIYKGANCGYSALGATGTNAITGLTEGSPAGANYNNMLGIDLTAL